MMHLPSGYAAPTVSVFHSSRSIVPSFFPPAEEDRARRRGCSDVVAQEVLPNADAVNLAMFSGPSDNGASPVESSVPQQARTDDLSQPPPTSVHLHAAKDNPPNSSPRDELQLPLDNSRLPTTIVPANGPPPPVANDPPPPVANKPPSPVANNPPSPVASSNLPSQVANGDTPSPVANDDTPPPAANGDPLVSVANDDTPTAVANDDTPTAVANKDPPSAVANKDLPTLAANDSGDLAGSPRLGIFTFNELPTCITPNTIEYWRSIPGGDRWVAMVQSYLQFEKMPTGKDVRHFYSFYFYNYILISNQCPARLPTESRPAEVSEWMKTRRYDSDHIPSVTDVDAFGETWVRWWMACQPPWRRDQEWPLSKVQLKMLLGESSPRGGRTECSWSL